MQLATIMTFEDGVSLLLGAFCMVMAFVATGMRGALSTGPAHPISLTGRIIFFLAGLAVFLHGFHLIP